MRDLSLIYFTLKEFEMKIIKAKGRFALLSEREDENGREIRQ
jgi:hypothetical protein